MSVQVEKLEKNMAKLTIEVAAEELEKAIHKSAPGHRNVSDPWHPRPGSGGYPRNG